MKKLINRIKYDLLVWLLGDICKGCSSCENCLMGCESIVVPNYYECLQDDVHTQARKVWGLDECNEK